MSQHDDEEDNWVDSEQRQLQKQVERDQAKDRAEILKLAKLLATSPGDAKAPAWQAKLIELRGNYERNASTTEVQQLRTALAEIRASGATAKPKSPAAPPQGSKLPKGPAKPKVTPDKPGPQAKDTPTPEPKEIAPPSNPLDGIWKQLYPARR